MGENPLVDVGEAVRLAYIHVSEQRARDPWDFGISGLPRCTRAAAYAMARVEPDVQTPDAGENRQANIGTWIHAGILPTIAELFGGTEDIHVVLHAYGHEIPGHIDLCLGTEVWDLKTVSEWKIQAVRMALRADSAMPMTKMIDEHLLQVSAYALAKIQAGDKITHVGLIFMDRSTGECETVRYPFTNQRAMTVINRVRDIVSVEPDNAPRTTSAGTPLCGPGVTYQCDSCPWLRRCWGDDVTRYEPRIVTDNTEVEELLKEYLEATALEGTAKRRKAGISALLERSDYGTYGDYSFRRGKPTTTIDTQAAIAVLKELGHTPPTKERRGSISIRVRGKK